MKYELGDYVEISKRWRKLKGNYVSTEDIQNAEEEIIQPILEKIPFKEQGYICGFRRNLIQERSLYWYEAQIEYGTDAHVETYTTKMIDVYLVATRMNCIYRVSKEDIKLIKDKGGQ